MPNPLETANLTPDRLLAILRRRKWLGLAIFILPLAAFSSAISVLPEVYEASATLLVERQQIPESYIRSTVTAGVDRRVHVITQALLSRSEVTTMIEQYQLYRDLRGRVHMDNLVERFRRSVRLNFKSAQGGTTAFTVTFMGRNPAKVAQVANHLASRYIDEDLKMRERHAEGTAEFLQTQLDQQLRDKLESLESKVADFKQKYMGELPSQMEANLSTLNRLSSQLVINADKQSRLRERIEQLEQQLAEGGTLSGPEAIASRIAALEGQLAKLRRRYTDKYPDVTRIKREIAVLENELERATKSSEAPEGTSPEEGSSTPSPDGVRATNESASLRAARDELRMLEREEARIKGAISRYQERVENAPKREQQFHALRRDYGTIQDVYQSILKRYEEAKLAQSLEHYQKGEQFRILDSAIVPRDPVAPNRSRLLFVSFALSAAFAGGAMFLRDYTDTSFHSADEFREIYRPATLIAIQNISTPRDRLYARLRFWTGAFCASAGTVLVAILAYVVARQNVWLTSLLS